MFRELAVVAVAAALLWATPTKAREMNDVEVVSCQLAGALAKSAMTHRQYGSSPLGARERIKAVLVKNNQTAYMELVELYITEAYKSFRYTTRPFRESAINDFMVEKEAECVEYFIENQEVV